jgi:uncharacterized protein involved in exopolysaccharide biosynthesis
VNGNIMEAIPYRPEADTFDLRRSWDRVKLSVLGHKRLIAFTSLCTVLVVLAYMVFWPPVYQAQVAVMADSTQNLQRNEFYNHWNLFRQDFLPDEVALMTSNAVLERVVDELELTYDDVYHPFLSHAAYLWGESWIGKTYRKAKAFIFPKPPSQFSPTQEQIDRARILRDFERGVALIPVPGTNTGNLMVLAPSPRAAEIANKLMEVYLSEREARFVREAQTAYDSLSAVARDARTELDAIEARLEQYYTENTMLLAYEKDRLEVAQWLEKRATIVEMEAMLASTERTLIEVDRQLGTEDADIVNNRVYARNPIKSALQTQLSQLELALEQTKLRYRADSPEVLEIVRQIDAVQKLALEEDETQEQQRSLIRSSTYEALRQRRNLLLADAEGIRARLTVERAAAAELENRVRALPGRMNESQSLTRDREVAQKKYIALEDKLMVAAVSLATVRSAPQAMRVVGAAVPPEKPFWPKTKLFLAAALALGAAGGAFLALVLDLVSGPVSRYTVSTANCGSVYAIVSVDREYLARLYSVPSSPKQPMLAKLSDS